MSEPTAGENNAVVSRAQAKAKRDKAIRQLRDTGMTDQEIANALGLDNLSELSGAEPENSERVSVDRKTVRQSKEIERQPNTVDDPNEPLDVEVIELGDLRSTSPMVNGVGYANPLPEAEKPQAEAFNLDNPMNEVANQDDSSPYTRWSEKWWERAKPEVRAKRCKAKNRNGSQCQRAAITGAVVCYTHGGAAPQVKQKARARIENESDSLARALIDIARDEKVSNAVRVKAINSLLDRAGLKAPNTVVLSADETSGFDQVFTDVFTGSRAESRRNRGMEVGPNDIAALGYSGDTQSESSRASVIDADGYEVTDSNPNIEGVQGFSRDTDISGTANRPGGRGYGGVGPNSMADYDRLRGPQSDRERFRVHHVTGEDAIRVARQQRELTAGD